MASDRRASSRELRVVLERCGVTATPRLTSGAERGMFGVSGRSLRAVKVVLTRCDAVQFRPSSAAGLGARKGSGHSLRAVRIVLTRCDSDLPRPSSAARQKVDREVRSVFMNGTLKVRVLQLNMGRSAVVTGEVRSLIAEKRLDILLLQEPYVRVQGESRTFYGLGHGTRVAAVRSERPWAAVAVCNPEFQITFISQLSTAHCVCAEISMPGFSFYVVSHYFQFSDEIEVHLRHLEAVLHTLRGRKVLVSLDANARSPMWGPGRADDRGVKLEELINSLDFEVVNEPGQLPTFFSASGASSYIDVTLSSPSMARFVRKWNVRDHWTNSDHNSIEIELGIPSVNVESETLSRTRFNPRKADWDLFLQVLTASSSDRLEAIEISSPADAERMAETLGEVLRSACVESMPRKTRFRKSNPWWTRQLTSSKRAVYRLRREFQKEQEGQARDRKRQEYRVALRKYSREIRKTKLDSWREFVSTVGNAKPWGIVYKQQADKLRVEKVISTIEIRGVNTLDRKGTAEGLLDVHVPDDRAEQDSPEQRDVRGRALLELPTEDAPEFTEVEVEAAVRALADGKAPGLDLIEVVVLKKALPVISGQLVRLYNKCMSYGVFPAVWKVGSLRVLLKGEDKDEKDPKSYRPICLLSVIGKVFEKLLKLRLTETVMAPDRVSGRQFGFTAGKSTEDAIVELRRLVEESGRKYVIGMLFDIAGAFDNVWWPLVLDSLRERECPKNVYDVLRSYFENRRVKIAWGDEEVSKQASRGCPQGSVLGPLCWNVQFDQLLKILEDLVGEKFVAYADDLIVLVEGDSREELERQGQRVVDRIMEWCRFAKLEISARKSEAILLKCNWVRRAPVGRRGGDRPDRRRRAERKPTLAREPIIKLGAEKLVFENSVRYLGVHFDKEMGVRTHCQYLREKTGRLFNQFRRIARCEWGLRFGMLATVYRGVFNPIVTYAAAGWSDLCTQADLRALGTAQRSALVAVTKAYRTASTESLCVIAGQVPIDILLEKHRARYSVRVGVEARIGNVNIGAEVEQADAIRAIDEKAMEIWQDRWAASDKGRTTFAFLSSVSERLRATWVVPCHFSSQLMTGHGNFNDRLVSLGLAEREDCECGEEDTAQHLLLDCEVFSPQREALRDMIGEAGWPEAARELVSTKESFALFAEFCRETLWIKQA